VRFGKFSADYFDKADTDLNFLNALFTNSPVINILGGRMGISFIYSPYDFADIEYGYFVRDEYDSSKGTTIDNLGDIYNAGWNSGGINIKPFRNESSKGNYRINFWKNNDNKGFFTFTKKNDGSLALTPRTSWGIALSADQKIHENITIFAKYINAISPAARPNKGTNVNIAPSHTNDYFFTQNPVLKWSWVLGVVIEGELWNRNQDSIGIGAGQIAPDTNWTDDVRVYHPNQDPSKPGYDPDYDRLWDNFKDDRETVIEAYYLYNFNEGISIIPLVQYLHKPYSGNAVNSNNESIEKAFIAGIKMTLNF
jgi:carbohydrate-selective porin OprB